MKTFEQLIAKYLIWVKATFPDETVAEQLTHLREELEEVAAEPTKADEYADVLFLLFCVAQGNGINLLQAAHDKFEILQARSWKRTEKGYRHS